MVKVERASIRSISKETCRRVDVRALLKLSLHLGCLARRGAELCIIALRLRHQLIGWYYVLLFDLQVRPTLLRISQLYYFLPGYPKSYFQTCIMVACE